MNLTTRRLACGVLALGAARAHAAAPEPAAADLKPGTYRAVLTLPGGELPFGLVLSRAGAGWVGYLVNGHERLKLDEVSVAGGHLVITMPGYENRLTAEVRGAALEGELVLDKLNGKDQHIAVRAERGPRYRFFAQAAGHARVAGRWSVTFSQDDGTREMAVGEFSQTGDVVTGTFLTDTGDHRFLAGQMHGDDLYLSTFDGAHAFLYQAKLSPCGALSGDYWSGTAFHERWSAVRDSTAALPDAYALTALHAGAKRFEFAFPDLSGHTVTADDAQFRGKVLIVALAGSWCPNCHDEAAFLAPFYAANRGRGVEVVSLMFEHFGDFERAQAATARFRRHYDIQYTTLIAGISDKDDAAKKLPSLDRVYAFPTVIFIDRKGRVRKIHTGFSGPATGEHYRQFVDEFNHTIEQLLAES
jgi:thiol-disulfide isomerase/thioredoxin